MEAREEVYHGVFLAGKPLPAAMFLSPGMANSWKSRFYPHATVEPCSLQVPVKDVSADRPPNRPHDRPRIPRHQRPQPQPARQHEAMPAFDDESFYTKQIS